MIGICAQDGHVDLATARATARTGIPMVASTLMADPLETVAAAFLERQVQVRSSYDSEQPAMGVAATIRATPSMAYETFTVREETVVLFAGIGTANGRRMSSQLVNGPAVRSRHNPHSRASQKRVRAVRP